VSKKLENFVLVIEDDHELRHSIAETLKRHDCSVVEASTLRDATMKLKNQAFDVVFMDMLLGEDSGEELIDLMREERKDQLNLNTPIIVISGRLDKDLVQGIAGKVQGALVKPFEIEAILACVEKFRLK